MSNDLGTIVNQTTVIPADWGQDLNNFIYRPIANLTALRAVSKNSAQFYSTLGYTNQGDSGGGLFYLDSNDTTSTDNGSSIIVATDGGRWKLAYNKSISSFQGGALGNGSTDDHAALSALDAVCFSLGATLVLPVGVYYIASNITFSSKLKFKTGAVLKPAASVVITITQPFSAPGPVQLFDLSNTDSSITLPQNMTIFSAEWWGASGLVSARVDNDVPINQAMLAVGNISGAVASGTVTLDRGNYKISNTINLIDNVWLEGKG